MCRRMHSDWMCGKQRVQNGVQQKRERRAALPTPVEVGLRCGLQVPLHAHHERRKGTRLGQSTHLEILR